MPFMATRRLIKKVNTQIAFSLYINGDVALSASPFVVEVLDVS